MLDLEGMLEAFGLTQIQAARIMGCSQPSVVRYLQGTRQLSLMAAEKLSQITGTRAVVQDGTIKFERVRRDVQKKKK